MKRRRFLLGLGAGALSWGCTRPAPKGALERALDFLESAQQPDGSWRSQHYRDMQSGYELTPMVAKALAFSGRPSALEKALHFLEGATTSELTYPVYTAALLLLLSTRTSAARLQAEFWKRKLLEYQLAEGNGWKPTQLDYGGWGYALKPPRANGSDPMAHSNLTSTCFAVGALGSGPALEKASHFVYRCQAEDGGFFACPGSEPVLNKAGPGISYGSASADGLRCLYRLKAPDERIARAEAWLEQHFSATTHPGAFPASRYEDRDSLYFYYAWSVAHAVAASQRRGKPVASGKVWLQQLVGQLESRQRADGSFVNPVGATREDDPLVATPMAAAVLALGRSLTGLAAG